MLANPTIVIRRDRLRGWGVTLGLFTLLALFWSSEIYSYQLAEILFLRAGEPPA